MKHSLYQTEFSSHSYEELLPRLVSGYSNKEHKPIADALLLAINARDRDSLIRPRAIDVACTIHSLRFDALTVQVALLSDPWLRDTLDLQTIKTQFGPVTADLVQKVNWLNTFDEYRPEDIKEPDQAELLRSMLLSVVNDIRTVLVKLVYRLQRLRIFKAQEDGLKRRIAQETLDIFAPLAHRLGLGQLKWELEDLSFRYLEPEEYQRLAKSLSVNRAQREGFIHGFISELRHVLEQANIHARVFGRPKHLYSIYRKMVRKHLALEELYDLHAVRIITKEIVTCYEVLCLVHNRWVHVPKEFDDYIAHPKENGYRSLHTVVVVGEEHRPMEIQIRTEAMHDFAEYGVAAHWLYKEGKTRNASLDCDIEGLRRLLEKKEEHYPHPPEPFHFGETPIFEKDIFVLTPKGRVIRLAKGATPVDFAYVIHTEVGHRCRGAKVNGRLVPLNYPLKSGEKVEILTAKEGGPSQNWRDRELGYVVTSRAESKIRAWFRQRDHHRQILTGKAILDREKRKLGFHNIDTDELAKQFRMQDARSLFFALGRAAITSTQLARALRQVSMAHLPKESVPVRSFPIHVVNEEIIVQGVRNLPTSLSQCCHPIPNMPIIGYITQRRGITIHCQECVNIHSLPDEKRHRLIEVAWASEYNESDTLTLVNIDIKYSKHQNRLKEITKILTTKKISILDVSTLHTGEEDGLVCTRIATQVADWGQLSDALDHIEELDGVVEASRQE